MKNILTLLPFFAASITLCLGAVNKPDIRERAKPDFDDPAAIKRIQAEAIEGGSYKNASRVPKSCSLHRTAKLPTRAGKRANGAMIHWECYHITRMAKKYEAWFREGKKKTESHPKDGKRVE